MVTAGDFKNGLTIQFENNITDHRIPACKTGKGAAFVRCKLKISRNGGVVEKTFRPTEKFENAHIERKEMQYLYNDGELFYFMDNETFDQIALGPDVIGDSLKFVKENENVTIVSHAGNAFQVEPPISVELLVTECEPGEKGNTAQGATKPCIVETGAQVMVPLFVNEGDTLKTIQELENILQEYNLVMKDKNRGIICIILSAFSFALMALFLKLSGDLPAIEKSFFRNLVAVVIAFIMIIRSKEKIQIQKRNLHWFILRSLFDLRYFLQLLCGRSPGAFRCFMSK